ncbi:MAG: molybdenum cofactor guanylyltransferase [Gemmataceae bacterium]|nr:molybdenum cofactor guanylyltransferase [Gemmataceae bacterium]
MRVGGIVPCGGRSSRMGRPKAWLPVGSEVMLQRVVRVLREVVDPVVVVAAPGQDVPPLPADVAVVRDEVEGRGPLAGLAAGLAALEGRVDAAYLSACDVPFLSPAFVRRILSFLASGGRQAPVLPTQQGADGPRSPSIAVPRAGGYHHPLAAAYRLGVLPRVRDLLAADRLRPVFLFDAVPTRVVEPHELADIDPDLRSLRNLNTPEDYAAALQELDARMP